MDYPTKRHFRYTIIELIIIGKFSFWYMKIKNFPEFYGETLWRISYISLYFQSDESLSQTIKYICCGYNIIVK